MAVSVLFPVYFRHPEASPLPGDSILAKSEKGGEKSGSGSSTVQKPASRNP